MAKKQTSAEQHQIAEQKEPAAPSSPQNKKKGRPTVFSQGLAQVICLRISNGESLRSIVKDEEMPAQSSVYEWLIAHPSFAEQYARAREDQADTLADEIIAIADEQPEVIAVIDKKTGALIEHKLDGAFLQWQKNRIDARKWTAMKLKPKKYGDRVQVAGDAENPLAVTHSASELFEQALKGFELKLQTKAHG
jgi:hypothetical protein